jgi:hypothetical protein
VLVDCSADPEKSFGELGNALRKIRIDTNVDIKFEDGWAQDLRDGRKRWAVCRILYHQVNNADEDGALVYIKPVTCQTEPPDVLAYQAANPDFSHQGTANQFFNESQTESYRMLGLHTREMIQNWNAKQGFPELVEQVRKAQVRKESTAAAAVSGK